ncbi:MAG: hypothetical protein HRU01_22195 [Myxococcales bacterium]|nr:hypothetical protein [Myxococcales bacterium]
MGRSAARIALLLGATALSLGVAEIAVRLLDAFSVQRAGFDAASPTAAPEEPTGVLRRVVHPYLAWVEAEGREAYTESELALIFPGESPSEWTTRNNRINRHGFPSALDDYAEAARGKIAIGIFGGSVAKDVATVGGDALAAAVAEHIGVPRSDIVVLNFSSGGFKQPQQVIALAQAIFFGIDLDVVLNVDGYNEIVAGASDSRRGHHPYLPARAQYAAVRDLVDRNPTETSVELAAETIRARRAAREIRERVTGSALFSSSALAKSVFGTWALRREREANLLEAELQEEVALATSSDTGPVLPDHCASSAEPCWTLIADLWEQGSRLMAAMSRSIGAQYLHVLQPNQYVLATKVRSSVESRNTYHPSANIPSWVRTGYPLLRERGARLDVSGVSFHDLTDVFAQRPETLYRDPCCHFNRRGNEIFARRLAELVDANRLGES